MFLSILYRWQWYYLAHFCFYFTRTAVFISRAMLAVVSVSVSGCRRETVTARAVVDDGCADGQSHGSSPLVQKMELVFICMRNKSIMSVRSFLVLPVAEKIAQQGG